MPALSDTFNLRQLASVSSGKSHFFFFPTIKTVSPSDWPVASGDKTKKEMRELESHKDDNHPRLTLRL